MGEERFDLPTENAPEGEAQEQLDADETENMVFESSVAMSVSAQRDAQIESSLAMAMVAGNNLAATDSVGGVFVAGGDLQLQQGGGAVMVVGGDASLDHTTIGLLLPGGKVNLGENSKILMTTQQALALGAGLGGIIILLNALLRRLRR